MTRTYEWVMECQLESVESTVLRPPKNRSNRARCRQTLRTQSCGLRVSVLEQYSASFAYAPEQISLTSHSARGGAGVVRLVEGMSVDQHAEEALPAHSGEVAATDMTHGERAGGERVGQYAPEEPVSRSLRQKRAVSEEPVSGWDTAPCIVPR